MKNRFFAILVSSALALSLMPSAFAVENSDYSGDIIVFSDECENTLLEWSSSPSWDGSHFYSMDTATSIAETESDIADELIISADVKFTEEGSGFLLRSGSYLGGQVVRQGDKVLNFASKSRYVEICECDADSWYNIVMNADFSPDNYHATVSVYKYNDDGSKTTVAENVEISLRTMLADFSPYQNMEVLAGTYIDNVQISRPMPDSISLALPTDVAFAGDTVQVDCSFLRNGIEFDNIVANDVTWEIYNQDNTALIEDVLVTVDSHGTVTIDPTTGNCKVYVRATLEDNGVTASIPLTITKKDVFTVTGIGVNEDKTAITEIKVNKNFAYSGNVTFVVAVYDENGILIDVEISKETDTSLKIGENIISLDDVTLPENFKNIKIMAWTSVDTK